MTRLAISADPAFAISLADAPTASGDPNYTLETLLTLRAALPAGGELFCLMGADSFLSLRRWHRAAEIPFAASLIVASRPNEQLDDLATALPASVTIDRDPEDTGTDPAVRSYRLRDSAGRSAPLYLLPELYEEVSATEVRERLASGQADSLLPAPVADYIRRKNLYR